MVTSGRRALNEMELRLLGPLEIVDEDGSLVLGAPKQRAPFSSARIGCQTFGIYGMDLAALCLRDQHRQ